MPGEVTREGKELIERWEAANRAVKNIKSSLNRAECEARNAERALGRWLLPSDAVAGEVFNVWYGNDLIQVTTAEDYAQYNQNFKVNMRRRK